MSITAPAPVVPFEAVTEEKVERAINALREHAAELRVWADGWIYAWNAYDVDAIVVARAQRSSAPLERVTEELERLTAAALDEARS